MPTASVSYIQPWHGVSTTFFKIILTERDTQLTCVKFQALIYKIEGYMNILHMHSFFFPLVMFEMLAL